MYLNELMGYQMSLIIIHVYIFLQNRLTNKIRSLYCFIRTPTCWIVLKVQIKALQLSNPYDKCPNPRFEIPVKLWLNANSALICLHFVQTRVKHGQT